MGQASVQPDVATGPKGPNERYLGHVHYASEVKDGKQTVSVRVKDERSPHHRKILSAASVHGEITLSQGLNVSFLIGTKDWKQGEQSSVVHTAVDVKLR